MYGSFGAGVAVSQSDLDVSVCLPIPKEEELAIVRRIMRTMSAAGYKDARVSFLYICVDCYKLENVSKVYSVVFEPIPSKGEPRWPANIDFSKMSHDKDVNKKK